MPLKTLLFLSIFVPSLIPGSLSAQEQQYPRQSVEEARENYERILENQFKPIEEKNSKLEPEERKSWKQIERFKYFWGPRLSGSGYLPNPIELYNQYIVDPVEKGNLNKDLSSEAQWDRLGPFNPVNPRQGTGRINVVKQHPKNPNEYWIGSAGGGVWKSENGGQSWEMLPNTNFLTLGISDIAFAPTNPDIVYLATGDDNGSGSGNFVKYTIGLMKSVDGGQTWEPTYLQYEQKELNLISTILIDPRDENVLIVSTDHGIFRSTDGAESFEHVVPNGNFRDMEFMPGLPDRLVATTFNRSQGGGISYYISKDNGITWEAKQSVGGAVRAELAVTPANPNNIYAIVAEQGTNAYHSTWYSSNYGETWVAIEAANGQNNNYLGWGNGTDFSRGGQGWYDLAIAADPTVPGNVGIGGVNYWSSRNYGDSFTLTTHHNGGWSRPEIHADIHDLIYTRDGDKLLLANDGGLSQYSKTTDEFTNLGYGLPITQFYKIGVSQSSSDFVSGGSQDNGTFMRIDGNWIRARGADGMETAIDPFDSDIRYASIYYGTFYRTTNGGQSWQTIFSEDEARNTYGVEEDGPWVTPFTVDQNSPNNIYLAMTEVWKSNNRGEKGTWKKISDFGSGAFNDIEVYNNGTEHIYAARGGAVFYTDNEGQNWETVFTKSNEVMDIAIDPTNPKRYALALSGFREDNKLFVVEDGNEYNLSGNLPNVSCNAVVFDPLDPKRMYVGTDIGVFTSYDKTAVWMPYSQGMLNTVVSELEIDRDDRLLYAGTYGTGIWRSPLIEACTPSPDLVISNEESIEICPGDSVLVDISYPSELLWSDGFIGNKRYLKKAGNYAVSATDNGYCSAYSEPFELIHRDARFNTITALKRNICGNDSVRLIASNGFSEYN